MLLLFLRRWYAVTGCICHLLGIIGGRRDMRLALVFCWIICTYLYVHKEYYLSLRFCRCKSKMMTSEDEDGPMMAGFSAYQMRTSFPALNRIQGKTCFDISIDT